MIVSSENAATVFTTEAAICVIGAGAAGITIACELDGCGAPVVLLDAGGLVPDLSLSSEVYRGTTSGRHLDPAEFRRVGFGGTTAIWGGRCVPYDAEDFVQREHVPHSGWPIAYEAVRQHYPRALEYCHAGADDFVVGSAIPGGRPTIPGLPADSDLVDDRIERYSLPAHFGRMYRRQIARSSNVTAVLHARCVRLHRRADGSIESAEVVDASGQRRKVAARAFVLATGAIETTRLLFVSDPGGTGLGNASDRLGRFYQCHFANVCGKLVTRGNPTPFSFETTTDGVYARRKLHLTTAAQRRHRLLNTVFRLHFPDYSDAAHGSSVLSGIFLLKSTLIPEYQHIVQYGPGARTVSPTHAHLRNVLHDIPAVVGFAHDWLFHGILARRKLPYTLVAPTDGTYPLEFNSEQSPLEGSRVSLTQDLDRYGMPGVRIDWQLSEADVQAGVRAFHVLRAAIARSPDCSVEFDDARLPELISSSRPIGGHHIGTARMAATEKDGVVDTNCTVYGARNLYVAGAAVFPTSSHANPTLTIVAMAIRLAGYLKRNLLATR
jgi:choline dehydrogenase-like flavoprotein